MFALALAALAFLLTGEAHLNLLCLPFATIIVGGVLIEQRRAEDPHIPILFGEVVHRTETHHTDLLMLRGPDLQWKTQDIANAWNLDIDGFREDVAAGRDLQRVLAGARCRWFSSCLLSFNLEHVSPLLLHCGARTHVLLNLGSNIHYLHCSLVCPWPSCFFLHGVH